MTRPVVRPLLNVVATVMVIVVNALANALPINGRTTGEISDGFNVFLVPAGYVFSIWGVIYLGLIAFCVYQALPGQWESAVLRRIHVPYLLTCLANVVWILLWHYLRFGLTLVAMGLLLVSLVIIYLRLDIGRKRLLGARLWCVHVPFSIYLAWVTVATIANVTTVLYDSGWGGWGVSPVLWAVIMVVVAAVITSLVAVLRRDAAFVLVVAWALVGIAVKQAGTLAVAIVAGLMALVVLVVLCLVLLRPRPGAYDLNIERA